MWNTPTRQQLDLIPRLYETENTPLEEKLIYLQMQKTGLIYDDHETDDRFYRFKVNRLNLPLVFQLGALKRRPHFQGAWIRTMENRLGHAIIPFRQSRIQVAPIPHPVKHVA